MKDRFNKIMISTFILGLFLVLAGSSYSLIDDVKEGAENNTIISANLSISGTDNFIINNTNTEEDDSIMFTLINNDNKKASYTIYIKEKDNSKDNCTLPCKLIESDHIKYELTKESTRFNVTTLSKDNIIDYGVIEPNSSINYVLKVWPYDNIDGTIYYGIIEVEGVVTK